MPRKGENIYKRKDGRWEGRYIKGHLPTAKAIYGYVYAYTYRDVKSKLNDAMNGKITESTIHRNNGVIFYELSQQWLANQQARIKESTYNKYLNMLTSYILPVLGKSKIEDITSEQISLLCDNLLLRGESLALDYRPKLFRMQYLC